MRIRTFAILALLVMAMGVAFASPAAAGEQLTDAYGISAVDSMDSLDAQVAPVVCLNVYEIVAPVSVEIEDVAMMAIVTPLHGNATDLSIGGGEVSRPNGDG